MIRMHFLSSVDSAHIHPILTQCQPEETLFIVASKTFAV
jgi:glucose-6-phosphate isomerase